MGKKRIRLFYDSDGTLYFCLSIAILLLFFILLMGCASSPQINVPQDKGPQISSYKYDIKGTINGTAFDGVGVIPFAQSYRMKVISRVDVDMLMISSCHRSEQFESAIKLGWFEDKRGYEYQFNPSSKENNGSCLVNFSAINKDSPNVNARGLIDFETPDMTMPSSQECNGQYSASKGVSICQSLTGLVQGIRFPYAMEYSPEAIDPKCKFSSNDGGFNWEYYIADGVCVVEFQEIAQPHRKARHTTVGYKTPLVRNVD